MVPESVLMEIIDHSTGEIFDRYNTVDEEDTRKAVDQLQEFFERVNQTFNNDDLKKIKVKYRSRQWRWLMYL